MAMMVLEHFRPLVELPVGDRRDHHRHSAPRFGELRGFTVAVVRSNMTRQSALDGQSSG